MSLSILLLAAAGAPVAVGLKPAPEVMLASREIRLGEVVDLAGLAPAVRARLAPRVIAVVPAGRSRVTLSRQALTALVRRSVPGLHLLEAADGASVVLQVRVDAGEASQSGCAESARPLAAGTALSSEDLRPVACRNGSEPAPLRFDRLNGVVRAGGDIAAGTYLGRVSPGPGVAVDKGDKVMLVASAGPVRVSREVVALQAGRPGGRLFVRDSEGNVTSAPLARPAGDGK